MFPFFRERHYSSPNFAWHKFQNRKNFARSGAPKVIMKLKQQIKYEKYDYDCKTELRMIFTLPYCGSGKQHDLWSKQSK